MQTSGLHLTRFDEISRFSRENSLNFLINTILNRWYSATIKIATFNLSHRPVVGIFTFEKSNRLSQRTGNRDSLRTLASESFRLTELTTSSSVAHPLSKSIQLDKTLRITVQACFPPTPFSHLCEH